jgi:hypothetical protein
MNTKCLGAIVVAVYKAWVFIKFCDCLGAFSKLPEHLENKCPNKKPLYKGLWRNFIANFTYVSKSR